MDVVTLCAHIGLSIFFSYSLAKCLWKLFNPNLLILQALPCKSGSQKGATFHCPGSPLCFFLYRRHKLCPARVWVSVCWPPNPHSAALKTENQSNYLSLRINECLRGQHFDKINVLTENLSMQIPLLLLFAGPTLFAPNLWMPTKSLDPEYVM